MLDFLSLQDLIIMGAGCICLVAWLVVFLLSGKYNAIFHTLNEKEYPLKELYSTGYFLTELFHYKFKGKYDRKLRMELGILHEEKYVEYYLRVIYAQSLTFGMLVFLLSFILYGFNPDVLLMVICMGMAVLAVYYFMTLSEKKIQKRSEELLNDFSEIVSKLALLVNAGMIMREAWIEVAGASDSVIYQEMMRSYEDMQNGVSESEAIRRFGVRCIIPEIKKFASTIIQGIEKGNRELSMMLKAQSDEIWEMKQQRVKQAGAKANTKLMIPMFIMFMGILIMIVVPIFTNLGV